MEIESYQSMLACVIAGAGVALMAQSMLDTLPVATGAGAPFAGAVRSCSHLADVAPGHAGANLQAWIDVQQRETIDRRSARAISA